MGLDHFKVGYQIGSSLGDAIYGSEDRKLNRETTRKKLAVAEQQQTQNDLSLQTLQMQIDDMQSQRLVENLNNAGIAAANDDFTQLEAIINNKQTQELIKKTTGLNPFEGLQILPIDDYNPDKVRQAAINSATFNAMQESSKKGQLLPYDYEVSEDEINTAAKSLRVIYDPANQRQQLVNLKTISQFLFPNAYAQGEYQKQQQAKINEIIKNVQEAQKAQAELNKTIVDTQATQNKMINENLKTQMDAEELLMKQQDHKNAQHTSQYLGNLHQQNPDRSIGTDGKGHITSIGATADGKDKQLTLDNIGDNQYQQARLLFEQSNDLTPQQVGTAISQLRQLAKQSKLTDDQFKEVAAAASKYVEKALRDGNTELAIEYQQVINSALELKVDDKAKQALQLYESANEVFKDITSDNGNPSEHFFDAFGGLDKLRNFFSALTGIIDIDQEAVFDALNRTKNLQSMIVYDMMGKRVTKHGLAQLPLANEWLTGTANLSVIRAHLDRVKAKAKADIIAGDPKLTPWAKMTYEKIEKFQKQIDDNIAFAQVIEGKQKFFSNKFTQNEIVKPGDDLDTALKTNKNVISFKTLGEVRDVNKQVNIYLSTDKKNPLQMSISEFNKITFGKYLMHTKDIR